MIRRVEYAAGASAGVLAIISFVYVLFFPIVCTVAYDKQGNCPSHTFKTLAQSGAPAWFWVLVICLTLLLGSGAAAAIAEARYDMPQYAPVLWVGAVLSLAACALTGGLGPFYFVAVVALDAAAYTSILPRVQARRGPVQPPASPDATALDEPTDEPNT